MGMAQTITNTVMGYETDHSRRQDDNSDLTFVDVILAVILAWALLFVLSIVMEFGRLESLYSWTRFYVLASLLLAAYYLSLIHI